MKLGSTDISKIYLGNTEVSKAYFGDVQVHGGASPVLPYDAQVEYLQSTGSEWINLNLVPKSTYKAEIKFSLLGTNASASVYGASGGMFIGTDGSGYLYSNNGSTKLSPNITASTNTVYTVLQNGTAVTVNSSSYTGAVITQNNVGMYLFGRGTSGGSVERITAKRIYYFKLWDGDNLIMDLIPVRVSRTGYMYDKVSGTLFGNGGTNGFVCGNEVTSSYDELLSSLTIASDQTPCIITDYYPRNTTKVKCTAALAIQPQTYNRTLLGTFQMVSGAVKYRYDVQYSINGTNRLDFYMGGTSSAGVQYTNGFALNTSSVYEFGNLYIDKDGTRQSGTSVSSYSCPYALVLFSNSNNGVPSCIANPAGGFVGEISGSIEIYEGSTLKRSYTPAKKNGRVGLWESVTSKMIFSSYGEFSE